ncbi:F-box only protein 7-like [Prorops nasuta]|uniref:F-box only protein 7-like n=1 Tax=Prorops nasuta TaxID=863751 RepID=UPI0034CFC54D
MDHPFLAEESTSVKIAPALEKILQKLDHSAIHHDYLVAFLILLLKETGFYVIENNDSNSGTTELAYIPDNWKTNDTGVYEIMFRYSVLPKIKCKLIAIPSGDLIILNFFQLFQNKRVYGMTVQTVRYVNIFSQDLSGKFYGNLKELSHRFKDTLASPVRSDILIDAGLPGPCLEALPVELKLLILLILAKQDSLKSIAQCSLEFSQLCKQFSV